jgi:hypothetical protein
MAWEAVRQEMALLQSGNPFVAVALGRHGSHVRAPAVLDACRGGHCVETTLKNIWAVTRPGGWNVDCRQQKRCPRHSWSRRFALLLRLLHRLRDHGRSYFGTAVSWTWLCNEVRIASRRRHWPSVPTSVSSSACRSRPRFHRHWTTRHGQLGSLLKNLTPPTTLEA